MYLVRNLENDSYRNSRTPVSQDFMLRFRLEYRFRFDRALVSSREEQGKDSFFSINSLHYRLLCILESMLFDNQA